MNVEIVTVGDELLLGFTVDSNAPFIARHLAAIGIAVARHSTCGDELHDISDAVRSALDRTGAVITTGGLGPTADDMSKTAVASVFGREMLRDESVVQHLNDRWRALGRKEPIPESNFTQAMIPAGAELLPNANGSAPGIFITDDQGRWVAMLPGVPREARAMFVEALLPRIEQIQTRSGASPTVIRSVTVRTVGKGESAIADELGSLGAGIDGTSLAFLPGVDGVDLRLTSRGLSGDAADRALAHGVDVLRGVLGDAVYGIGDVDLAAVVVDQCRIAGLRIAVAESCTGGLLGARITDIPGASDVFHGGLIAYDNRVKRQLLGVLDSDLEESGAVSEPVALQMAKGIRVRLGTEIGVSITGIAGPGGGTPEKPVGTVWIGIDIAEGRPPMPLQDGQAPITPYGEARVFHVVGNRDEIRRRAAQIALNFVRRTVAQLPNLPAS